MKKYLACAAIALVVAGVLLRMRARRLEVARDARRWERFKTLRALHTVPDTFPKEWSR